MPYKFMEIAATLSVLSVQEQLGTAKNWTSLIGREFDTFTEAEVAFIAERDSFYIATVSETGWPYVQHRGGPAGFLKMIDARTLAFADYSGNKQYISTGNLSANNRACLFLMDYAQRARLKMYVEVDIIGKDEEPALTLAVTDSTYRANIERIYRLRLETFDWNCPQHITPRFTRNDVETAVKPLKDRLAQLEDENRILQALLYGRTDPGDIYA